MAWQIIGADPVSGRLPPRVQAWIQALIGPRVAVLLYSSGEYRQVDGTVGRPEESVTPSGWALYKGPVQPTDWLPDDEWEKTPT